VNLSAVNACSTRHIFGWRVEYVDKYSYIYVFHYMQTNKRSPPTLHPRLGSLLRS
jgi:hypothetical protein